MRACPRSRLGANEERDRAEEQVVWVAGHSAWIAGAGEAYGIQKGSNVERSFLSCVEFLLLACLGFLETFLDANILELILRTNLF